MPPPGGDALDAAGLHRPVRVRLLQQAAANDHGDRALQHQRESAGVSRRPLRQMALSARPVPCRRAPRRIPRGPGCPRRSARPVPCRRGNVVRMSGTMTWQNRSKCPGSGSPCRSLAPALTVITPVRRRTLPGTRRWLPAADVAQCSRMLPIARGNERSGFGPSDAGGSHVGALGLDRFFFFFF